MLIKLHVANPNMFSYHYLQSFSLWAVSKRKFKGLSLTTQDVGIVLAISGI